MVVHREFVARIFLVIVFIIIIINERLSYAYHTMDYKTIIKKISEY